ncbi:hypothetical protein TCE0_041r13763 [Talaromyces pinophilus]|uniref:Uncharacterized protein n=1 Tax=Talaromyces pinophilus TaxID=128442 RepID=A0A6V8HH55_TALPI|nr:Hypothetical protein PENO1_109420 [Penicillium occitanis (nom. inval.)]PCG88724.1 hypothetical protein PENOC_109700 [Penicillium occitanis (nom. inval.)]GAM40990.1 hypothetical protein TCE0_041r13763 [Talaromyces pinophilus]
MPKLHLDRDPVTLQEGSHIAAQVGDKMLRPDTMEYISGDVDHITIYRSPSSSLQLNCTRDVEFLPGEQVVLQQLDPVSYAAIGLRSGKEVEFKE